ncbi:MAG: VOC family protein [Chloroflexi bacterium]|nr:VOC family protein [Chloroflexota bacterium]
MERSRLRDVVMDCARPSALAAFWAAALSYRICPYDDAEIARLKAAGIHDIADDPEVAIESPDGGPRVWFVLVAEPKTVKNRVHLDINLRPGETLNWLVSLGATILTPAFTTPRQRWTVLADPEGNEFCAFTPDA